MTHTEHIMTTSSIARITRSSVVLAGLVTSTLSAQGSKTTICLAPTTAQMASGNTADGANAVRETLSSYLTGPTLAVAPLNAKLASQTREEAKQASCSVCIVWQTRSA